jgi:hypothetical protein
MILQQGPQVELRLAGPPFAASPVNSGLDPNVVDDLIIGEVLAFREAHQGSDVRLLSIDSDQVVSAKHFGINFLAVPDAWHLPPEQDGRDKRIQELERGIAELEELQPKIAIAILDVSDALMADVSLSVLEFQPLSDETVSRLVSEATRRTPPAGGLDELVEAKRPTMPFQLTQLAADPLCRFEPPTKAEVANYREVAYPGWVERVRGYFEVLHEHLGLESRAGKMKIRVRNNGSRGAKGMVVTFQALGGLLLGKIGNPSGDPMLPPPPKPPQGKIVRTWNMRDMVPVGMDTERPLPALPSFGPRDRYAFYRKEGGHASNRWSFECDLFRHGGYEKCLDLPFFLPVKAAAHRGIIHVEVFARNMSRTVLAKVPVNVTSSQVDTNEVAMKLLNRQLPPRPQISIEL